MTARPAKPGGDRAILVALLPMLWVMLVTFFVIGMAMPVLPLHVPDRLGKGTFVVGLVAGSQFGASLLSRLWAGRFTDRYGGKPSILAGLVVAALAGATYLVSLRLTATPGLSAGILIAGRGVLGFAEGFVVTGALGWGLAIGGEGNAGKVMAWMRMGMFAAFASGAPVGSALYAAHGFSGIAVATVLAPLLTMAPILRPTPAVPRATGPSSIGAVFRAIRLPGLGLALASMGFGSMTIFVSLLFAERQWPMAWGAFTAFGIAFVLARLLFGHLPDRLGGARVALFSLSVEGVGLILLWMTPSPVVAFVGAGLTGFGYSLVFPAFGLEAIRRAPPASRAQAMGTYTACLDLALGWPARRWAGWRMSRASPRYSPRAPRSFSRPCGIAGAGAKQPAWSHPGRPGKIGSAIDDAC